MVIFNSYVKLPEGIKYGGIIKSHSSPPVAPQAQVRRLYMSGGLIVGRREEGISEVWPYSSGPSGTSFTGKPPGARCKMRGLNAGNMVRTCQNHGKNDGEKPTLGGKPREN